MADKMTPRDPEILIPGNKLPDAISKQNRTHLPDQDTFAHDAVTSASQLSRATSFASLRSTLSTLQQLGDSSSVKIYAPLGRKNQLIDLELLFQDTLNEFSIARNKSEKQNLPENVLRIYRELLQAETENKEEFAQISFATMQPRIIEENIYWPTINNKRFLCLVVFNKTAKNNQESLTFQNNWPILSRIICQLVSTIYRLGKQYNLEQKQNILAKLVSTTEEAFSTWSPKTAWVEHNKTIYSRIGYPEPSKADGEKFDYTDIIIEEDLDRFLKNLDNCFSNGEAQEQEYRIKDPQGNIRIISSKFKCQLNDDGEVELITAISVDISDNKQKEVDILARADLDHWLLKQTSILYHSRDKIAVTSTLQELAQRFDYSRCILRLFDGANIYVYAEWHQANQKSIHEVIPNIVVQHDAPRDPTYIFDTEQLAKNHRMIERSRLANFRAQMIIPLKGDEQLLGYLICQKTNPHHWQDLEKKAADAIAETLTKLIIKESLLQELEVSEKRNDVILDAASFGVWEYNILEKTVFIGPHYFEMLGFDADKNRGFAPIHFKNVHIDDRELLVDNERKLASGEVDEFSLEVRHLSKTGDLVWILMRGRVIKWDDTGKPIRATGTMTDITTLKRTDADLQIAYQEAEAAHIAKSEFLARMSHEIRTPMNAVIGMSYLALQSPLTDEQRGYVEDIDTAAKSLLQIIDDILDFSKIEAGKLILEHRRFNFSKHIERVANRFKSIAQRKNLVLTTSVDPNIPAFIASDSTRLRQILANLLDNAFKFTKSGSVILSTKLLENKAGKLTIEYTVADSGIGLSKKQIKNLFDPFTQADGSSSREYGGTGLGLAIAKQLVNLMDGEIRVESSPGKGARFKFTIVCNAENEEEEQQNIRASISAPIVDQEFKGKKILLVEDNRVNQKVATGILKHKGLDVTLANNGTEAVYIMKASHPGQFSAILMDIEMPYMDGFEATEAIRAISQHANIPIIAMTAHAVQNESQTYIDKGMSSCISKPILPAELYKTLETYLKEQ
ncbi:ATP-binding protein [Aurantivibrio infirmus]